MEGLGFALVSPELRHAGVCPYWHSRPRQANQEVVDHRAMMGIIRVHGANVGITPDAL